MSILISMNNPNTIYLDDDEDVIRNDCYKDPRKYKQILPIYLRGRKNFLTDSETIERHRTEYNLFERKFNRYCCFNCLRYLTTDMEVCLTCHYFYCKSCSDMFQIWHKCPMCK